MCLFAWIADDLQREEYDHNQDPVVGEHQNKQFNLDDIPISSKKLTFEELLAQNLQNEQSK